MEVRCQICGRKTSRLKNGTVKSHHVRSDLCPGSLRLPYEVACDAIDEEIRKLTTEKARWSKWLENYWKGNRPPADEEFARIGAVSNRLDRMERRRQRWEKRNWIEYYYGEDDKGLRPPTPEEAAAYIARYSLAA